MDLLWIAVFLWFVVYPALLVACLFAYRELYRWYKRRKRQREREEVLERFRKQEAPIREELGPMIKAGWHWHNIGRSRQYVKEKEGGGLLWVELVRDRSPSKYVIHGLEIGNRGYEPTVFAEHYVVAAKMAMELEEKIASGWVPEGFN